MQAKPNIFTIGIYGTSENAFFQALLNLQIDTFCDVRNRRGIRGSIYAYANSTYLQQKLRSMHIRYIHCKALAPEQGVRAIQAHADNAQRISKRSRERLSPEFIQTYQQLYLASFNPTAFLNQLGPSVQRVALFCVERHASACHRSLIAARFMEDGFVVEDVEA